jgi:hypothetical protein
MWRNPSLPPGDILLPKTSEETLGPRHHKKKAAGGRGIPTKRKRAAGGRPG